MTLRPASALYGLVAASALLLGACRGSFEPDVTGPVTPPPPPPVTPNLPFRLGGFGPDFATGVVTDGLGNATITGYFQGSVDFNPGAGATVRTAVGGADAMVAKYRSDGTFAWVFSMGGSGPDLPSDIALTPDGGTVITGVLTPGATCNGKSVPVLGGRDAFLMKVSSGGACEWAIAIGGAGDLEDGRDLLVEPNGDILVTGSFTGTVDFDQGAGTTLLTSRGGNDAFVARYTSDGSFKAVVQMGGLGDDAGSALTRTGSGDVIVGGEFTGVAAFGSNGSPLLLTSAGESDFFLAQLAPSLGLVWAVRGGGSGAEYLAHNSLVIEPGGTLVVVGLFSGTADLDGGPATALLVSQGATDIFFARYGVAGQYVGSGRRIGGAGSDGVQGLMVDSDNNFYLAGWFSGTVDLDPGPGTSFRTSSGTGGAADALLLSLTPGGDLRWADSFGGVVGGGASIAITAAISQTTDGAIWAVGRFFGRADLDPAPEAILAQALGDADQFVVRVERGTGLLRR